MTVRNWTEVSRLELQACFDCTEWRIFEAGATNPYELPDTMKLHVSFCEDMCMQIETSCTCSNNEPWFTPSLRKLHQGKEEA